MLSSNEEDFIYSLVCSFASPFLLEFDPNASRQWTKLRKAFKIARHLAYLTLDLGRLNRPICLDHFLDLADWSQT